MFENVGSVMPVWGLRRIDPGFLYVIENHDRFKIGKTKKAAERLRAAKTWLPDMKLIGFKPFWGISYHERTLHSGFAQYSYWGEWFDFTGDGDARETLVDGFTAFTDDNPDRNSVDFIYWFNGDGMAEIAIEMDRQKLTLPKFQKQESGMRKRD